MARKTINDIREYDKKVTLDRVKKIKEFTTDDAVKETANDIIAGNITDMMTILEFLMKNAVIKPPRIPRI